LGLSKRKRENGQAMASMKGKCFVLNIDIGKRSKRKGEEEEVGEIT
jgi:hypothetical protein